MQVLKKLGYSNEFINYWPNNMHNKSAVVVLHDIITNSLVLTKRNIHLRHHPGEICFPGGRWEIGDDNLWITALRELKEEIGVDRRRVELIQALKPEKSRYGSSIFPWFASISNIKPFVLNKYEVAALVTIPMAEVLKPKNYREILIDYKGQSFTSCEFIASEEYIWGATARIMLQLCTILSSPNKTISR